VLPPTIVHGWRARLGNGCSWYLERELKAVSAVLHIFLRVIEAHLLGVSDATSARCASCTASKRR
jgi:hypothetical protein